MIGLLDPTDGICGKKVRTKLKINLTNPNKFYLFFAHSLIIYFFKGETWQKKEPPVKAGDIFACAWLSKFL